MSKNFRRNEAASSTYIIILVLVILSTLISFFWVRGASLDLMTETRNYLLDSLSDIPLTVSFGSALALTLMFVGSHITTPIIKTLLIPMWILVGLTYLLPNFAPKEYNLPVLGVFVVLYTGIVIFFGRSRKNAREADKRRILAREIVLKVNEVDDDSPYRNLIMEDTIVDVLKEHRIK